MAINKIPEIIDLMGRLAGLQFRVENHLYLPLPAMAAAEGGVIIATKNRCFTSEEKFEAAIERHTGAVSRDRENIYPAALMIERMAERCSALRLLSRRLIYKQSTGDNKRGSRFHAEIWFDTGMIQERISSLDVSGIHVWQQDNMYLGIPTSYMGGMRKAKRYDSLYYFYRDKAAVVKPREKREKPPRDRFVTRVRRESRTTAEELINYTGSIGERGKQFL